MKKRYFVRIFCSLDNGKKGVLQLCMYMFLICMHYSLFKSVDLFGKIINSFLFSR